MGHWALEKNKEKTYCNLSPHPPISPPPHAPFPMPYAPIID
ncbi:MULTISPECIES: hypothetical protein [Nostoc]|nr:MULTISPECIES: hypothetical protein [Nostoc]